jgi:D-sedoheptulose 7-phosphate isomerase
MNKRDGVYFERVCKLAELLLGLQVSGLRGSKLSIDEGFEDLREITEGTRKRHKTIFLIGNGASASMASHIAADLCKNGSLSTEVFTDLSLITAVANDLGSDRMYSVPLERRGTPGDVLVAISSSGRSPNILNAVAAARKLKMKVISFSAMSPENPLRYAGDINFYVATPTYGYAESAHSTLLHFWVDMVAGDLPQEAGKPDAAVKNALASLLDAAPKRKARGK